MYDSEAPLSPVVRASSAGSHEPLVLFGRDLLFGFARLGPLSVFFTSPVGLVVFHLCGAVTNSVHLSHVFTAPGDIRFQQQFWTSSYLLIS